MLKRLVPILSLLIVSNSIAAQRDTISVMTYNLMYYLNTSGPCTHSVTASDRDAAFELIFNEVKPDILAVQEMPDYADNSAARYVLREVINVNNETNYISADFSNNGFSDLVNQVFFDTTKVMLYEQSHITNGFGGSSLARVIDVYTFYYKDPFFDQGTDTVFFTLVNLHLKAGSSTSDEVDREDAIKALMPYLATNIAHNNIMVMGDFNTYSHTEGAIQEMINYGDARVKLSDPVGQLGNWNNNSAYALVHTQSTHYSSEGCFSGGGLDDRFDMILVTDAIDNGSDYMTYIPASYKILGQDGQHFNSSVNWGGNNAVSSAVADALYDFSDHLPVYCSFELRSKGLGFSSNLIHENSISIANPFHNNLTIRKEETSADFSGAIYNLNGQLITTFNLNDTEITINSSQWQNGLYILSLSSKNGEVYRRPLVKATYAK